jgi:hypothetical protein
MGCVHPGWSASTLFTPSHRSDADASVGYRPGSQQEATPVPGLREPVVQLSPRLLPFEEKMSPLLNALRLALSARQGWAVFCCTEKPHRGAFPSSGRSIMSVLAQCGDGILPLSGPSRGHLLVSRAPRTWRYLVNDKPPREGGLSLGSWYGTGCRDVVAVTA